MDDLLRGIYQYAAGSSGPSFAGGDPAQGPPIPLPQLPRPFSGKTEVWQEFSDGGGGSCDGGGEGLVFSNCKGASGSPDASVVCREMTLEDFLVRAGAVMEEEVRVPSGFAVDPNMSESFGQRQFPVMEYGDGVDSGIGDGGGSSGGGGRVGRVGRRRAVLDSEDKAALQRQKRMIKNRESAARSRERKQAYTVKLEAKVSLLEAENARLVKEKEELKRMRLQHLGGNVEKPRHLLRRTRSMEW